MRKLLNTRGILLALTVLTLVMAASPGTVTLKTAWVEKYKNRATIDASFIVDHAHKQPNPPQKDGDIHVAGRADQDVGLPMVAEVMNAALAPQQNAVKSIHQVEGKNQQTPISGVWRLWFEHPSATPQVQFDPVPPAGNTNPDHCFEIHPITKFGTNAVPDSFQFVPNGTPYDAKTAFGSYEKLTISIKSSSSAVSLTSPKAGYNYTEFWLEFAGPLQKLDDGGSVVFANVLDKKDGTTVAEKVRMIFAPNTLPAQRLSANPPSEGDQWHVLGIPRVNLEAVWTYLTGGDQGTNGASSSKAKGKSPGKVNATGTSTANRKLPYEMIIVGVE